MNERNQKGVRAMTDDRHRICPECGKKSHIRDSFEDGYCMVCASKYGALRINTEKAIELLRRVQDFCKDNNWHKEQGGKPTVSLHRTEIAELKAKIDRWKERYDNLDQRYNGYEVGNANLAEQIDRLTVENQKLNIILFLILFHQKNNGQR